jgi:hypothetical protein
MGASVAFCTVKKMEEIIDATLRHNHETEHQKEAKADAKRHGRAGRYRGKAKAKQNNKARGGKLAR